MAEKVDGCVKPSKGPIVAQSEGATTNQGIEKKEVNMTQARVGKPAPDFELAGFFEGGFKNFKLSELLGKWIVVCFYPGDFTFV
ncbi:MAG: redoxin domain-containing protein [Anaerolineaceae bacterium]|nr:redoxin domain-containing protein [Anaerolineaceae bacterium]